MDEFKPEFWAQQWAAFWSAPAIMGPLLLIAGFVVWWLRGTMFEREVAGVKEQGVGLKEQIAVLEQRLKLAAEGVAAADRAKDDLEKQFQAYKADVAANGRDASPAKVDAAIVKVADSNSSIGSMLLELYGNVDAGEYGAHRNLGGLGGKNLDPEIVKYLQDEWKKRDK